ncbi:hypothetical protein A3G67_04380 [Candidatus Roizmanbacteria bacterium RIFCSPLOWO2_12_FULL_40_12]|uniref:RRM domain-containing protein n=1 Tax=Candidatus Roizmanbacteria bacterium RIFCSPLOWO2_01_FULL_40_42 TaxID=1802066 RepID=A0A1F7J4S9_9BACT|nr:MAG: hypothetical protein A2779_04770 [Candidatus Roizmanbacteria bacterium RIFCSPHIGHO2_01_FULL_40_98]OGK27384.1 MAG: hypothetical protein A3C31_05095 [Candidatus Roizmanbacteria bacterium RIFCSPHIGHO2_02_FULL_40_53]OGK30743.1 MAG: hypothetical protein A2W49_01945 [Candidatus Roizmanbacteria bacterium RIFCSPHIGHO2_12_41_18]OGK50618.1 MAG: hypothetical protein A3B50_02450 [Candidatus Roizmanbacteria bacterium RIFCSPLOWO2_01_FULL_40_42]OGK58711.1 MAG: hypothetical protein A3H84_02210 [Candida
MTKNKLFVGNLPSSLSSFSLERLFTSFGKITDASIIPESSTGRSKGFGFVTFKKEADAKKAQKEMNGKDVEGQGIVVNIIDPKDEEALTNSYHAKRSYA